MTLTLTPEMEALIDRQMATGQFASREEVMRIALLSLAQQHDELKAAINEGMEDIKHGRVAPLDVAATLARVRARQAAQTGAESCGS